MEILNMTMPKDSNTLPTILRTEVTLSKRFDKYL